MPAQTEHHEQLVAAIDTAQQLGDLSHRLPPKPADDFNDIYYLDKRI